MMAQENSEEMQAIIDRLDEQSKLFVAVSQKVIPSVVHISTVRKVSFQQDRFNDFFGDDFFRRFFRDRLPRVPEGKEKEQGKEKQYRQMGMGTGIIIDNKGYILSNNHVIKGADKVIVKLSDKREIEAKVVGADEKTDVAVLKIEGDKFTPATLGDSSKIAVGQWVVAIGNPFGLSETVTAGIISAKGRAHVGIADYEDFIQTDAAINPGNSGGPLVNLRGEVIGINTAIVSRSGGYQGIGFAIPINMARSIMEQLVQKGKVTRGWLGVVIQEITQELAKSFNLGQVKGALIADIMKGSPAEQAGLRQGDVVIAYNGVPVESVNQLRNMVANTGVGERIAVEIYRENNFTTLYVVIGDLSKVDLDSMQEDGATVDILGLDLQNLNPELAKKYGYDSDGGVVIVRVKPESPLAPYMLAEGDLIIQVNRMKVKDLSDLRKALERDKDRILLLIKTKTGHRYLAVPKPK